jgi:hypothetical protein
MIRISIDIAAPGRRTAPHMNNSSRKRIQAEPGTEREQPRDILMYKLDEWHHYTMNMSSLGVLRGRSVN